jgi:hypothetical protein
MLNAPEEDETRRAVAQTEEATDPVQVNPVRTVEEVPFVSIEQDQPGVAEPPVNLVDEPAEDSLPIVEEEPVFDDDPAMEEESIVDDEFLDTDLGIVDRWGFPVFDQTGMFRLVDLFIDGLSFGLLPPEDDLETPLNMSYLERQCIAQGLPEFVCRQRYGN